MATYAPPPGVIGPTWSDSQIKAIIDNLAAQYGLPADIAEAGAQVESGWNPYAQGDKTDGNPTSFGLYQLHIGGELEQIPGPLPTKIASAYDPTTNARVAIRQIASVYQQDPTADPGTIVANAQRPANKSAYAKAINGILGRGAAASAPSSGGPGAQPVGDDGGPFGGGDGTTTYKFSPIGPSITIWSWDRIGFALLGALLVLLGIYLTFKDSGGGSAQPAAAAGGKEPAPPRQHRAREVVEAAAEA